MELTRESGLLKQQIEFVNKKLEELTKNNEETNLCVESIICKFTFYYLIKYLFIKYFINQLIKTLVNTKREVEAEYNNKIETIRKEKEELSNKISIRKRENRELEQAFLKQTCIYDKEKQQLLEKVSTLEARLKEMCEHYRLELDKISLDMNGLKEESDQKVSELKSTVESFREKNYELERENKNILAKKNDLKNKMEFLENQMEESKISMTEMQNKCETFLKNALSKAQLEKEHMDKDYQEKISILEHNYASALQRMEDENKKLVEVTRDHKEMEDELINLSKQASSQLKLNDPIMISNKIQELLNVQDKLRKENEEMRLEKEKKIAELISKHEREKEIYNIKILEYDVKLKNYNVNLTQGGKYDPVKSPDNYDLEKERIKWKSEREKLINTIESLNMQIQKVDKKYDNLHKENEQFRSSQYFQNNNNNPNINELNKFPFNRYFANSNNTNTNFFSNNGEEKISSNRFSMTSRNNISSLNDKEILLDNLKKTNNTFNFNMHMMNSPNEENRNSNVNNINKGFLNNDNYLNKEHQTNININSPIIMKERGIRKDSYNFKLNTNNQNNNLKVTPHKMNK